MTYVHFDFFCKLIKSFINETTKERKLTKYTFIAFF